MATTDKPSGGSDEERSLPVLADPVISKGVYSNLVLIRHTKEEFILEFLLTVEREANLVSRVILSPDHVRRLVAALNNNLDKHEARFAEPVPQPGSSGVKRKRPAKRSRRKATGSKK